MKVVLLSLFLVGFSAIPSSLGEDGVVASDCIVDECKIEDNCRCSISGSPLGSDLDNYPQLISLTFDEAVNSETYNKYWQSLLNDPVNPDGAAIGATFFVPHEYTDYQSVNDLYNLGFEIGVHSISENNLQSYWREATEETLTQEFAGQKQIIAKFANIPDSDIIGVRTPQLQIAGNHTIKAYINANLQYDSSWPTVPNKPFFPYTLDHLSTQDCNLGTVCPNEAFPGFWVLPIIDLHGKYDPEHEGWCNTLGSCNITGDADTIANWLVKEVDKVRTSTKAPLTLSINSYWFNQVEQSFEGLQKALATLQDKQDVFFVSQSQVLEWIKSPVQLSDFKTNTHDDRNANCSPNECKLKKGEEIRYMSVCSECPEVYPWLGNPEGKQNN